MASLKTGVLLCTVLLAGCLRTLQFQDEGVTRKVTFPSNHFFGKGGLGLLSHPIYVELKNNRNSIRVGAVLWKGMPREMEQAVACNRLEVVPIQQTRTLSPPAEFIVLFTPNRIYFRNQQTGEGGYYERLTPSAEP